MLYNYNPDRTRNSLTACGPQFRDIASLEVGEYVGVLYKVLLLATARGNFLITSVGRMLGHLN